MVGIVIFYLDVYKIKVGGNYFKIEIYTKFLWLVVIVVFLLYLEGF